MARIHVSNLKLTLDSCFVYLNSNNPGEKNKWLM